MSSKSGRGAKATSLLGKLHQPVDAASTAFFRLSFGLAMAWGMVSLERGGLLELRYLTPHMLFKYPGFEWILPWPEWGLRLHVWLVALSALMIGIGLFYRLATVCFFLGYTYLLLLDAAAYNNHYYLFSLFGLLLIFIPAHRTGSVDAWRSPALRSSTIPAWALWILSFQVGVPYLFGGLAKINYDWLMRAEPMSLWLTTGGTNFPVHLELFDRNWAGYFFSWTGFVFDLLIVPALLYRRTRPVAFLIAVAFHLSNSQLFTIGLFPWVMIAATTVYFAPDWPRRIGFMKPLPAVNRESASKSTGDLPMWKQRLTAWLLGLYLALQILLPFRHFLYPGWVDWTEEGHRFAWRMKLRDKRGDVRFAVVDRDTRTATFFDGLDAVLVPRQRDMMRHEPEMMRQFARFLADTLREQGREGFEVRVLTDLSLNAREPQALIDPTVDLAAEKATWLHASWIMPLEPLPGRE